MEKRGKRVGNLENFIVEIHKSANNFEKGAEFKKTYFASVDKL